jgi:hypothetical protein
MKKRVDKATAEQISLFVLLKLCKHGPQRGAVHCQGSWSGEVNVTAKRTDSIRLINLRIYFLLFPVKSLKRLQKTIYKGIWKNTT